MLIAAGLGIVIVVLEETFCRGIFCFSADYTTYFQRADSKVRLLYVTPERMAKSKRFMNQLQKCASQGRFARLAIDEVHCCSTWGHDFRPDYNYLGVLKDMFPGVPILGLTATSSSKV